MQVIIFIGIQATGKSIFYKENFFDTHVRIKKVYTSGEEIKIQNNRL